MIFTDETSGKAYEWTGDREATAQAEMLAEKCQGFVSPVGFLRLLYGDDGGVLVSTSTTAEEKGTCRLLTIEECLEYVSNRSNAYIFPARFFAPLPKKDLTKDLLAFVVDLDDVMLAGLRNLLRDIEECPQLTPSHIVKTGGGYHLWYVLTTPIQWRKRWTGKLEEVNAALYDFWHIHAGGCICDTACKSIPHGFRMPGAKTKTGEETICFQVGEVAYTSVYDLAEALDISLCYRDGEKIDFAVIDDEKPRAERKPADYPKTKANRHPGLYEFTLREIPRKTWKGHRYLSMFALAGIAWDCGIPKQQLRADLEELVKTHWTGKDPVLKAEIDNALKGYNAEFAAMRRETREDLLGWRYPGKSPKRNYGEKHKTRSEHMREVHRVRKASSLIKLMTAITEQPKANKRELSKIAGLSYPTVLKYYDRAREIADL